MGHNGRLDETLSLNNNFIYKNNLINNNYLHNSNALPSWLLLPAAFFILAVGGFCLNFSTGIDDAHITYFVSNILANQGEILNYNLQRVEQSSSLLHVLLGALLSKITGINSVTCGHIVPLLAGLLCLVSLHIFAKDHQISPWPVILCASSSGFVYWNFAGLEAPLSALLMLLYVLSINNGLKKLHWLNALAIVISGTCLQMTRPEMILFVPALTITISLLLRLQKHSTTKTSLTICMLTFIIAALITLWRYWYFGDVFPQPVTAKSSGITMASLHNGFLYVAKTISNPWTAITSLIGAFSCMHILWKTWQQRISTVLSSMSITIIGYSALIILMGGDWMPAGRLWVTIIPLTAITISYSLSALLPTSLLNLTMAFITLLNMAWLLAIFNYSTGEKEEVKTPYNFFETHSPDNYANIPTLDFLQTLVAKILPLQPSGIKVLSGQMGMIPYHLSL